MDGAHWQGHSRVKRRLQKASGSQRLQVQEFHRINQCSDGFSIIYDYIQFDRTCLNCQYLFFVINQ